MADTNPELPDVDPILERMVRDLFAAARSLEEDVAAAKSRALTLIQQDVEAGRLSQGDAGGLRTEHALEERPRSKTVPPYTAKFEREMIAAIDENDKVTIRELLRRGWITKADAESAFRRLGFNPDTV